MRDRLPWRPIRSRLGGLRRWQRAALVTGLLLLLPWLPTAAAQQLAVGIVASARPAMGVALRDVPRAGGVIGAAARLGVDPGAALSFRWSEVIGGVGNLVVEGDAATRFGGGPAGRATLGARGVLGPVAARVHLDLFSAPPERFEPVGRPADAPFEAGSSLRIAGDGRLDRTWLVGAQLRAWHSERRWLVDVDASARARALLAPTWDGRIALASRWGANAANQSLGLGVVWAPRRAPDVSATLWLDRSVRGTTVALLPGAELDGSWRFGADTIAARIVLRPAGRARAAWSFETSFRHPWNGGTLVLRGGAHAGGVSGRAWTVGTSYERPIDLSVEPGTRGAAR